MAILTGNISQALLPGITKFFGLAYKDHPEYYSQFMDVQKSRQNFEQETMFTGLGLPNVMSEGAPVEYADVSEGWTKRYSLIKYGRGFVVTREAVEDDQAGVIAEFKAKALARAMKQGMEHPAHNVLNNAFNSSYTGGDAKELCATDHPLHVGGTFSNELATPADFSESSVEDMVVQMKDWVSDDGLKIMCQPRKLILPNELCFEAERYLKSINRVGTADNDINAIKSMNIFSEATVVSPFLTDADAFFILTDQMNGLKMKVQRPPAIEQDGDFDTDKAKFKSTMRFSVGWTDPRCIIGTAGAA